jgi:hypothetical protein
MAARLGSGHYGNNQESNPSRPLGFGLAMLVSLGIGVTEFLAAAECHAPGSQIKLAKLSQEPGQRDKAIAELEEKLAKQKEKLGPDHPDTLISMANLAFA